MSLATNLNGRLRNTALPSSNGLLPMFEAVINAIHAVEDAGKKMDDGHIEVQILRDKQDNFEFENEGKKRGPEPRSQIVGFQIADDGIGFTPENFDSFLTLDSEYKSNRGGRGVGRLLWLKAFRRAIISSRYQVPEGRMRQRDFVFTASFDGSVQTDVETEQQATGTTVILEGFNERLRDAAPKTGRVIAKELLDHALSYFVRDGGAPHINVVDSDDNIDLHDLYDEQMVTGAQTEEILIDDQQFRLIHIKIAPSGLRSHTIAYLADNRVVKTEGIKGRIPGLHDVLKDGNKPFIYECYVTSPVLDKAVRSERIDFDLPNLSELRDSILDRSKVFLDGSLVANRQAAQDRVEKFVSHTAPRYRPILSRIQPERLFIDPEMSNKELDLLLHKHLAEIEAELISEGHEVLSDNGARDDQYAERLREYLKKAEELKMSDLANYVAHRRVILDIFGKAIRRREDGLFEREDVVHNLIFPMRKTSDELMPDDANLWLLDERLAFHHFLASDKPISTMPITSTESNTEPDLTCLNLFDNPILAGEGNSAVQGALIVVELKKPMRNDHAEGEGKDPIEQALNYVDRIRNGTVTSKDGRPIPNADQIPAFCYIIADLTPTMVQRCRVKGATKTADGMGYFTYNPDFRAYIEVMSFDRLLIMAQQRNRAFFDKLGLPAI